MIVVFTDTFYLSLNTDGDVQERSKDTALCTFSVNTQQNPDGGIVTLHEEVLSCIKYVRVVQDMFKGRCEGGVTEEFQVDVGLHQGWFLSPFLFALDRLTNEVRQDYGWIMMFADDIVNCSESREPTAGRQNIQYVCQSNGKQAEF